jgi:hypothetical protein
MLRTDEATAPRRAHPITVRSIDTWVARARRVPVGEADFYRVGCSLAHDGSRVRDPGAMGPLALLGRMDKGPGRLRTTSAERVRASPQKSPQFCCVAHTQPVLAHRQFVSQLVK